MTTIAELIADELRRVPRDLGPLTWEELQELANEITKLLVAHGFGHVPTALNEAADALEREASDSSYRDPSYATDAWLEAAVLVRTRAAETGGTE